MVRAYVRTCVCMYVCMYVCCNCLVCVILTPGRPVRGVVPFFRREASPAPAGAAPTGGRDETAREVRGMMRVGNYASRTMVKGESVVELVLMCASESWAAV